MLPVIIPIPIMIPTIMLTMMTAAMGMAIMMLMMIIVMVLMPIVVRILPSRFPAGSAVVNGSPRGSLSTFASAQDATAESGNAMMWPDCTDVKLCT